MKHIFIIFVSLFMASTTYGQEYYKIKLLELKGKVKCIRIIPEVIKENIDSHGRRETATIKYQIDKKGNWIRKEFYNDYGLYLVIKREITYY